MQVWTYTGDFSAAEGKPIEPMCLHVYVRPATIESFKALNLQGAWRAENKDAIHSISPAVSYIFRLRLQRHGGTAVVYVYCCLWHSREVERVQNHQRSSKTDQNRTGFWRA